MAIVPTSAAQFDRLAVPLPRYAQLVGVPECSFFGVYREDPTITSACPNIWSQEQRNEIEQALFNAQEMIENELTYPVSHKFISAETHVVNALSFVLDWRHIIGAGVQAFADLAISEPVAHGSDPVTVSITTPAGVVTEDEIRVYHPGTDDLIFPSAITITPGALTDTIDIYIPKCRLVKWALRFNPISGLAYSDNTNFESAIDIKREYLDSGTQARFRKIGCLSDDCGEDLSSGCVRIKDAVISNVEVRLTGSGCSLGDYIDISYMAGLDSISLTLENAVIRLAHSLMVATPCPCDGVRNLWIRDRDIPERSEFERKASRFGVSNGAWYAWQVSQANKIIGGSNFA